MDEKKLEPTKLQTDFIFEKMRNEIDRLTAELKTKDEEIEKLASHLLAIDSYCRVNDIDLELALKGH